VLNRNGRTVTAICGGVAVLTLAVAGVGAADRPLTSTMSASFSGRRHPHRPGMPAKAAAPYRYNLPVEAAALLASIVGVFLTALVQPHTPVRVLRTVINTLLLACRILSRFDHA
jgi:hypothetical protein